MANRRVEFSKVARIEFHKAKCLMDFNGKEQEFWLDVDRQIELIRKFPYAFQIRYKNVRVVALENFNFSIHYMIDNDGIMVLRFLNQKQDF